MIKHYCDKCGKELDSSESNKFFDRNVSQGTSSLYKVKIKCYREQPEKNIELCKDCIAWVIGACK
jgi:hypothetical protein